MKRLRALLPLLLLVSAGIVLFSSGVLDRLHPAALLAHQQQLQAYIADEPWLARAGYVGLLTLAMCTGVPGTVVIIFAGGFAFGVVEGTLYSSLGLTLGSLVLFLASRYAFGRGSRHPPSLVKRLHAGFERHPVGYTLFLRFVPVAPFGLITVCLAWLRCPLWLFIGASWLGGTVALVFETSVGAGLGDVLGHSASLGLGTLLHPQVLWPLLALAALAVLPLVVGRLTHQQRRSARPITHD